LTSHDDERPMTTHLAARPLSEGSTIRSPAYSPSVPTSCHPVRAGAPAAAANAAAAADAPTAPGDSGVHAPEPSGRARIRGSENTSLSSHERWRLSGKKMASGSSAGAAVDCAASASVSASVRAHSGTTSQRSVASVAAASAAADFGAAAAGAAAAGAAAAEAPAAFADSFFTSSNRAFAF